MPLEPPDTHHYLSAIGWLELGNPREALEEINLISSKASLDPEVLELRWHIYSELKQWELALKEAEKLIETAPENPSGWINRSYALHEMKQTKQAYDLLLPAADKFPQISIIPYNLSCYSCQLGRIDEAIGWFKKALNIAANKEEIKEMALSDNDLKQLWEEIKLL